VNDASPAPAECRMIRVARSIGNVRSATDDAIGYAISAFAWSYAAAAVVVFVLPEAVSVVGTRKNPSSRARRADREAISAGSRRRDKRRERLEVRGSERFIASTKASSAENPATV